MAPLKLHSIVSCSSQDPAFPAENLLKNGTNYKWKSKAWEQMVSVIIQLEKPSVISGIDIGNESSAFVEVLVGCDKDPDEFKIILSMSALMTPRDSLNNQRPNQVRIFRVNDLHLPVCTEKWDKIKIVCSQPFNKVKKYGLAFIKFHGYQAEIEESPSSLCGLLGSPVIKDSNGKKTSKKVATPKRRAEDSNGNTRTNADKLKTPNKRPAGSTKQMPSKIQNLGNEQKSISPSHTTPSKRPIQDDSSSSSGEKRAKLAPNDTETPFHKILEGVEVAISGYINPSRAEIRWKAFTMGAKYWSDWTPTCTHLICAFPNTPKYNKVKGNGRIVTRAWIDDCYENMKRLPWRKYATDTNDRLESSDSEEVEVCESVNNSNNDTNSTVGREAVERETVRDEDTRSAPRVPVPESFSSTVEEIERLKVPIHKQNDVSDTGMSSVNKRRNTNGEKTTERSQAVDPLTVTVQQIKSSKPDCMENSPSKPQKDENKVQKKVTEDKFPEIPDFFKNKFFYIHPSVSKGQMERVERCIVAFCGTLRKILDGNVHFAIAKKKLKNEDDAIGVPYVKPEWIWKCNDAGEMVSICDYIL